MDKITASGDFARFSEGDKVEVTISSSDDPESKLFYITNIEDVTSIILAPYTFWDKYFPTFQKWINKIKRWFK